MLLSNLIPDRSSANRLPILVAVFLLPNVAMAESLCPSNYDDFLAKFEASREFQQDNLRYPLEYSFVDSHANPEPKTTHQLLSKSDVAARARSIYPLPRENRFP